MPDEILIVGGYGQVGGVVADRLGRRFPGRVVVAGRSLERAVAFARESGGRVRPRRLDVAALADPAAALDDAREVVMCVDQPNAGFARACLARGIRYVDVTATYRLIEQVEALHDVARRHSATAVLSVGLAPGVTNLLAHHVVSRCGVFHIEQVFEPREVLAHLEAAGFRLHERAPRHEATAPTTGATSLSRAES